MAGSSASATARATGRVDLTVRAGSVSGPPSRWDYLADRAFQVLARAGVWAVLIALGAILWQIARKAGPGMRDYGVTFLTSTTWDANKGIYGILPEIWGTLYSSLLALLIGGFFGVVMAIFLTQDFLPPRLAQVFRTIVELLAAIPSVVYGLWGLFVVVPVMRPVANWFFEKLGWIPSFARPVSAPGRPPPAVALAIMVFPTVPAASQDGS